VTATLERPRRIISAEEIPAGAWEPGIPLYRYRSGSGCPRQIVQLVPDETEVANWAERSGSMRWAPDQCGDAYGGHVWSWL
jgi:hypothetical protein